MIKEKMVCDTCGKEAKSDDYYEEKWIRFEGDLTKGIGRKADRTGVGQWIDAKGKIHHFCSWECLEKHDDNSKVTKEFKVEFKVEIEKARLRLPTEPRKEKETEDINGE